MPDPPTPEVMAQLAPTVRLWDVAHARAGDKGDSSILVVRPYEPSDLPTLVEALRVDAIAVHFGTDPAHVSVTPVPGLTAVTIVVRHILAGGVTRSPRVDPHGKTLSGHLLDLVVAWRSSVPHYRSRSDVRRRPWR